MHSDGPHIQYKRNQKVDCSLNEETSPVNHISEPTAGAEGDRKQPGENDAPEVSPVNSVSTKITLTTKGEKSKNKKIKINKNKPVDTALFVFQKIVTDNNRINGNGTQKSNSGEEVDRDTKHGLKSRALKLKVNQNIQNVLVSSVVSSPGTEETHNQVENWRKDKDEWGRHYRGSMGRDGEGWRCMGRHGEVGGLTGGDNGGNPDGRVNGSFGVFLVDPRGDCDDKSIVEQDVSEDISLYEKIRKIKK